MENKKYYIGIDLGGTFIKGGIADENGNLILKDKVPTESKEGNDKVVTNISSLCLNLMAQAKMDKSQIQGIGMGVPGLIDSQNGIVKYSNNLYFENFDIAGEVGKRTGLPVKIANDANVAALGETKFGSGKEYDNTVLLTLGTGVGGGVVIDGKLFEGNGSAGAELGHTVVAYGGEACGCGRVGCLEAYASATALIRDTKRAMEADKNSQMWEIGSTDAVTGKTAFDYMNTDKSAKSVVDNYIEMLGVGIVNLANIFRPQAIILGGGVCAEGERLVNPLQEKINKEIFAGPLGPQVKLLTATLKNDAGILGAVALIAGV